LQLQYTTYIKQKAEYIQRSPNALKIIFQNHFNDFSEKYSEKYDTDYGRVRLERIKLFSENFLTCGDYTRGA